MTDKPKIEYGDVDLLSEDEFNPENMMISMTIYNGVKAEREEERMREAVYQQIKKEQEAKKEFMEAPMEAWAEEYYQ